MATNLQTGQEPSVASLATGIIHDFQELVKQQLELFKHELKADVRKTREVVASLAVGLVLLSLGGIVVCFGLAELLFWLAPVLQRWGSYLIVGGLVSVVGVGLSYYGYQEFRASNLLPEESAEALKENLEWTTKPK
jgi:uncharacterized membrane protein YqjE